MPKFYIGVVLTRESEWETDKKTQMAKPAPEFHVVTF